MHRRSNLRDSRRGKFTVRFTLGVVPAPSVLPTSGPYSADLSWQSALAESAGASLRDIAGRQGCTSHRGEVSAHAPRFSKSSD